jgi:hypothetical protein
MSPDELRAVVEQTPWHVYSVVGALIYLAVVERRLIDAPYERPA